jgi:hypothetical protein
MATTPAKQPATRGATRGAAKAARASAAAGGDAGAPAEMTKAADGADSVEIKLKDLIEKVTSATGAKKPQVRTVIEAMLKEMGGALAASQVLNLPGLGKLRVVRQAETPGGTLTLKLRRGAAGGPKADAGAEPLAEPGEDS